MKAAGKADFVIQGNAYVPNNIQNYFGTGNETPINKTGDYQKYYRARFNLYNVEPALRWRSKRGTSISVGPGIQYYQFDTTLNVGRFIQNISAIHTYDAHTLAKEKLHAGLVISFESDKRSEVLLPVWGSFISIRAQGYQGLTKFSESFAQLIGEVDLYKSINARSTVVLAERVGGTFTVGHPAFYQTALLGGRENLMG